ncbi:MAG: endonuclease/exonuclease/phosphatase family protein [Deltaproteobacteria bacterium]|nr:endonuclease/exonuclease/phosphatase family protein [Deltaproteobacteria bacterium]MBW2420318.1 endonuclease/exonuclease/phosphatase family protein [Deltaproteobacteria bacterium]
MSLSVLSLNLWHDAGPYSERVERIREWVDRLDPDLIGLQEVYRGNGSHQAVEILGDYGYHFDYVRAGPFRKIEFGNAVASRWPLRERAELKLPESGDGETRAALAVEVDSPFGPLCFTVTHLNWMFEHGAVRERQVVALCDFVLEWHPGDGFPTIVVGDFNAEPESDEIRYMTGLHSIEGRSLYFNDAWRVACSPDAAAGGTGAKGITWSNRNPYARTLFEPDRRIDYIFTGMPRRDGIGLVEQCRVVCNDEKDGVWPSDHFGVYAELRSEPVEAT